MVDIKKLKNRIGAISNSKKMITPLGSLREVIKKLTLNFTLTFFKFYAQNGLGELNVLLANNLILELE
jgi:hypothetical protein